MQRRSEQSLPIQYKCENIRENFEESSSPTDTAGRSGSGRPHEWEDQLECLITKRTLTWGFGHKGHWTITTLLTRIPENTVR